MLFNSLFFLFVFFPIVTGFYYFIPHKFRWVWLLVASCYFYMSFIPSYLPHTLAYSFPLTMWPDGVSSDLTERENAPFF